MTTPPRHLSDAHRAELLASGIPPEFALAAGVYTEADPAEVARLLNWRGAATALGPCLVYPYLDAAGHPTGHHRLKPTTPRASRRADDAGKRVKYEGPKGRPNRLYVPPGTRAALADPAARLLVTEGEKKALSAAAAGFACVSVAGVWAWQRKREADAAGVKTGRRELIPDLAAVAWAGRPVAVVFAASRANDTICSSVASFCVWWRKRNSADTSSGWKSVVSCGSFSAASLPVGVPESSAWPLTTWQKRRRTSPMPMTCPSLRGVSRSRIWPSRRVPLVVG